MSAQSRWLRINIDWDDSDWVASLPAGAQLAWVKMLCHVKRDGSRGRVKALSPARAAQKWGVKPSDITALIEAGVSDNAVIIDDGFWVIANWAVYQPNDTTNADRQKAHRDKKRTDLNLDNGVIDGITPLYRHATVTETVTEPKAIQEPSIDTSYAASAAKNGFNAAGFERWFEQKFKPAYPKRSGSYEWPGAKKKLEALFRAGKADKEAILDGLARYSDSMSRQGKTGTELVKQAATWVNKRGWEDEYGSGEQSVRVAAGGLAEKNADITRELLGRMVQRGEITKEAYDHAVSAA